MIESRAQAGIRLGGHLAAVTQLRRSAYADPGTKAAIMRLKTWQSDRLARTYPDLLASPRYHDAAQFFLNELYGPKDFSQRDSDVERILPKLTKLLPAAALSAIADAVALDQLSEELDQAVLRAHCGTKDGTAGDTAGDANTTGETESRLETITQASYAAAYCGGTSRVARTRQIALTQQICTAVDKLTHIPLMLVTLKLMRAPANLAGLSALQRFLEGGFVTFKAMGGADEFIATIVRRETRLMQRLYDGTPEPFAGLAETG